MSMPGKTGVEEEGDNGHQTCVTNEGQVGVTIKTEKIMPFIK